MFCRSSSTQHRSRFARKRISRVPLRCIQSSKWALQNGEEVKAGNHHVPEGVRPNSELLFYGLKHSSPVSLKELIVFGSNDSPFTQLLAAQFLHQELPIRLAQRVRELKRLPLGLSAMPSIKSVINLYESSFWRIRECPSPKTSQDELSFTELLADIKDRHVDVQQKVAHGIRELKRSKKIVLEDELMSENSYDFGTFLDRFYMARISLRMLIGQHIALHNPMEGHVGIIDMDLRPVAVVKHVIQDATRVCTDSYGAAPIVTVDGSDDMKLAYVPSHLYYVVFEILKNSMRAVVETHGIDHMPPIHIALAEGKEDVSIKITDLGGGIPRSGMKKLWTYAYTTATRQDEDGQIVHSTPMAGFGYGLPLSRLYARYFGGDLQVISMDGQGTDAYIHVSKLGNVDEQLP